MTTTTTTTSRLDEIVERNSRSRIVDVAFAAMVAMLLVFAFASMRASAASPITAAHGTSVGAASLAHAAGGVCEQPIC